MSTTYYIKMLYYVNIKTVNCVDLSTVIFKVKILTSYISFPIYLRHRRYEEWRKKDYL
jgi:hypothetical protein